jgi:hypothetical protein
MNQWWWKYKNSSMKVKPTTSARFLLIGWGVNYLFKRFSAHNKMQHLIEEIFLTSKG